MSSLGLNSSNRPVPFGGRSLVRSLGLSSLAYGIFLALAISLARTGSSETTSLLWLHLGSALSFYLYWRLGRWGDAKFDCFGAAVLLFALLFRLQAAIDLLLFGTRVEDIPVTVLFDHQSLYWFLKGEVVTHIGLLLIVSAWRLTIGSRVEEFSFRKNYGGASKHLSWAVYLLALAVAALLALGKMEFGALTQFAKLTYSFGVVSIYFIASRKQKVWARVLVAFLLALPMMALAVGSAMKSEIFFPAVPAVLLYWFGYRSVLPRASAVLVGVAVLALSQLYIEYARDQLWALKQDVSTPQLIANFGETLKDTKLTDGLDSVSRRINLTTAHAITVSLADRYGFEPLNVFGTIPASFIPRILWPGKPIMAPGILHTARIYNWVGPMSEILSSTAPGFAAELYLGGGYWGLLLGAIIYGWLLGAAQKVTLRLAPGFGHLAFSFLTFYWALRLDEHAVVYAYTSIVLTIVFVGVVSRTGRLLGFEKRYLTHKRASGSDRLEDRRRAVTSS